MQQALGCVVLLSKKHCTTKDRPLNVAPCLLYLVAGLHYIMMETARAVYTVIVALATVLL
jgi:hypothetical protein